MSFLRPLEVTSALFLLFVLLVEVLAVGGPPAAAAEGACCFCALDKKVLSGAFRVLLCEICGAVGWDALIIFLLFISLDVVI